MANWSKGKKYVQECGEMELTLKHRPVCKEMYIAWPYRAVDG